MSKHVDSGQTRTGKVRLIVEDSSVHWANLEFTESQYSGVISLRRWMGLPAGMPSPRSTAIHRPDWPSIPSRSNLLSNWKSWFLESNQAARVT